MYTCIYVYTYKHKDIDIFTYIHIFSHINRKTSNLASANDGILSNIFFSF